MITAFLANTKRVLWLIGIGALTLFAVLLRQSGKRSARHKSLKATFVKMRKAKGVRDETSRKSRDDLERDADKWMRD